MFSYNMINQVPLDSDRCVSYLIYNHVRELNSRWAPSIIRFRNQTRRSDLATSRNQEMDDAIHCNYHRQYPSDGPGNFNLKLARKRS